MNNLALTVLFFAFNHQLYNAKLSEVDLNIKGYFHKNICTWLNCNFAAILVGCSEIANAPLAYSKIIFVYIQKDLYLLPLSFTSFGHWTVATLRVESSRVLVTHITPNSHTYT